MKEEEKKKKDGCMTTDAGTESKKHNTDTTNKKYRTEIKQLTKNNTVCSIQNTRYRAYSVCITVCSIESVVHRMLARDD